ncbi:MAG: efflux RND transporter periplasmic adaptor subunit [Myxococcaceae bacterium]|nr:efflux RND transporter periplasmic adaptor subunit [Myxococcaceae bacterium]
MRLSLLFISPLVLFSCTSSPETPAAAYTGNAKPKQDGVVQIKEASRPFIAVEPVNASKTVAVLKAPARVAFKDGAMSQLGAPFAGRVERVHVKTGDKVKPGDALVTLDCPEAAAARTALATADARLKEARVALQRTQRMVEQGVGSEREKLEAETKLSEAEAEFSRAQASALFVGAGAGTAVVLRAPIAGTVLGRAATVGAAVQPGGEPVIEVGDPSALWIVADIFERDLALVHEGAKATVELNSVHEPLLGSVTSIGTVVTNGMRTVPVRISLDNSSAVLRPGMFGRVGIESFEGGITLPTEAVLIKDGKDSVVYVEQDPITFVRRSVVVAQPVEGKVQVISGIVPGDKVVVGGALLLDGSADQLL